MVVVLISVLSCMKILNYSFQILDKKNIFFSTPIYQGIISGIAVLIMAYYLLNKFKMVYLGLLVLNVGGVFVSHSKAAFLGVLIFVVLMVMQRKRKVILVVLGFTLLTIFIPNPIRDSFVFSIKRDPYALNRLDIWRMSISIFTENFLTGVGPDNFSEIAKKYNFKQTQGPANYFKVPYLSHNDYLQFMAENGIAGAIFLLSLGYVLIRNRVKNSLFKLSKILVLYLLFLFFLFNLFFHVFFFFIFIFLLKDLFENRITYRSINRSVKVYFVFLLITALMVGNFFPLLSEDLMNRADKSQNVIERFEILKTVNYINPLDAIAHYQKARLLFDFFRNTSNLEYFYASLKSLKKVQSLNRYFVNAYLLESDIYFNLLQKHLKYPNLFEEIILPLSRAETYDPFNPFIKLKKAEVYLLFNQKEESQAEAVKAISLEPEYISALLFLEENFRFFANKDEFNEKISNILKKAEKIKPIKGTYLFKLYQLPKGHTNLVE
jgi:hypothetical protein